MKCQDCTFLGQIPVSNMLKAGGNVLERGTISSKWEGLFFVFFFLFLIIRTQVRGEFGLKALCQDLKPLDPWKPKWQTSSSSLTVLVNTGLPLVGCTGQKRPDGSCGEPKTFLGWKGGWNSHWTSLSLGHLQNQNSCWATQSTCQWHLSAGISQAYRACIDTWSVDNSAWLVMTCCCMPLSPQCLPNI